MTRYLVAAAGGSLVDERGWRESGGARADSHAQSSSLFARLSLGTPVLSGAAGVDRREQRYLSSPSPSIISETYSAYGVWRPVELPELELRISRSEAYDRGRAVQDTTTDAALFATRWISPRTELRYLLGWTRLEDHRNLAQTTSVEQTALATRTDRIFADRTSTYVSASVRARDVTVATEAGSGTVSTVQVPAGGLSAVVTFPAAPEDVALAPNANLVDGATGVSAGLDVGYGPSALADANPREAGVRFADAVTAVNTLYLWLDRTPSPAVGQALRGAVRVYESVDGQHWTAVTPVTASVSPFENRLEISIPQRQSRYLKVSLRPLDPAVTTDPAFRDVFVTELQVLLVLPAALVPRSQHALAVSATGIARTMILRGPELAHDLSATVTRQADVSLTTYTVVNGLTLSHAFGRGLATTGRLARQDVDAGLGREGEWQWSASLAGNPLQTAFWSLTYSGKETDRGDTTHAVTALGRADWYDGISSQAAAGASQSTQGARIAQMGQVSASTSLTPNPVVTFSLGALYSRAVSFTRDTPDIWSISSRVDGTVTVTPAPALSGAATVSRVVLGPRPTTIATVQLNYFPLRGDIQLSASYSKTLDTEAQTTTELLSPSLRWNLRRGVSLTTSYTYLHNVAPAQVLTSRAVLATLLVAI